MRKRCKIHLEDAFGIQSCPTISTTHTPVKTTNISPWNTGNFPHHPPCLPCPLSLDSALSTTARLILSKGKSCHTCLCSKLSRSKSQPFQGPPTRQEVATDLTSFNYTLLRPRWLSGCCKRTCSLPHAPAREEMAPDDPMDNCSCPSNLFSRLLPNEPTQTTRTQTATSLCQHTRSAPFSKALSTF